MKQIVLFVIAALVIADIVFEAGKQNAGTIAPTGPKPPPARFIINGLDLMTGRVPYSIDGQPGQVFLGSNESTMLGSYMITRKGHTVSAYLGKQLVASVTV